MAPSHIGCLIHGCFNASIPKPEQMSVAQWQDLGLKIGDELKFQVLHLDSDAAGVFFIRGGLTKSRYCALLKSIFNCFNGFVTSSMIRLYVIIFKLSFVLHKCIPIYSLCYIKLKFLVLKTHGSFL